MIGISLAKIFKAETPQIKQDIFKTANKIPTPDLQRLCQNLGDRFVSMHNGVVPGSEEECKQLGNAFEFFTQNLRTRATGTGVQAKAMKTYLENLLERVNVAKQTAPTIKKATDVAKFMQHSSNEVSEAAAKKAKEFIYTLQEQPSFPNWVDELERQKALLKKSKNPLLDRAIENLKQLIAKLTKNLDKLAVSKTAKKVATIIK